MQVSILHPLATLTEWEECAPIPIAKRDAQCVLLHNKLYVGGGYNKGIPTLTDNELFESPTDQPIKWKSHKTPTSGYALTTYRSQLVLIGGIDSTNKVTDKVWTSDTGTCWKSSLPETPTKRWMSTAENIGDPECLVLAGGRGEDLEARELDSVEVFTGKTWWTVEPLPGKCSYVNSTLHDGRLYLVGGFTPDTIAYYCDVQSLIAQCREFFTISPERPLWNEFKPLSSCSASFGRHLVFIGGRTPHFSPDVVALSHLSQAQVHVGEVPIALHRTAAVVLPIGDLVVIGGATTLTDGGSARVFRTSLKGEHHMYIVLQLHCAVCNPQYFMTFHARHISTRPGGRAL